MLRPIGTQVMIQPTIEARERGGILLPERAGNQPTEGTVVTIGGKVLDVKPGDRVLLPKSGGSEITIDGKMYLILEEQDLLGTIEIVADKKGK